MKKGSNLLIGILFILAAVVIIASEMGYLNGVGFVQIIFTILWTTWIIKGLAQRKSFPVFGGIAFLSIVWKSELGIEDVSSMAIIGAAILLSIGWTLIFGGRKSSNNWEKKYIKETVNGECIKSMTRFGGVEKYIDSQNLKSVDIKNEFGGTSIYMDKATAAGNEVAVRVNCSFGGVEIYIPKEWNVENHVKASFGAIEGAEGEHTINGVTMVLVGDVKFGAVEIIRV